MNLRENTDVTSSRHLHLLRRGRDAEGAHLSAREQAELFMRLKAERGGDVRSWAEVTTVQQPLPEFVMAAKQAG